MWVFGVIAATQITLPNGWCGTLWLSHHFRAQLDLLRGYCLLELGRNDEALRALDRAARDARWASQANAARDHLLRNRP